MAIYLMTSYKDWKNKDLSLFRKRKEGAEKIAVSTKEKGGPSKMTAWHFQAKLPQYDSVFKVLSEPDPENKVKAKFDQLVASLSSKMDSQRHFQEIMGEIEVWGEVLVQLRKPENY